MLKKVSSAMNEELKQLIDSGKHFGQAGSIDFFQTYFLWEAEKNLKCGGTAIMMQYINVLYSGMTSAAVGGIFGKIHAIFIAWRANIRVGDMQRAVPGLYKKLDAGECHVLMSLAMRSLQILQRMHISLFRSGLKHDLEMAYTAINEKEWLELSSKGLAQSEIELCYAGRLRLLAEGLLLEIHRGKIFMISNPDDVERRIKLFADHNRGSTDREISQLVARLYRTIGRIDEAHEVACRAGNVDQMNKSTV